MVTKVYNLIILDESGSMSCIKRQAIDGVNETFNTIRDAQKEHKEQEHLVSFITFDSRCTNVIYDKVNIAEVNALTEKDYDPCACTPLYDAMGFALTNLRQFVEDRDLVLVTIITDGYENSSTEYSGRAIKALVDELRQKQDWVFTYIGANQDVEKVAADLGISNHLEFKEDVEGTKEMFRRENRGRKKFIKEVSDLMFNYNTSCATPEIKEQISKINFFEEDE